jgi:hypothetical protein
MAMDKMHLEFGGKSGHVLVGALPSVRQAVKPVLRTRHGSVGRVRLVGGLQPRVDPAALSADELVRGDPELDIAMAGVTLEETMGAYFDPAAETPEPIGHFQQTEVVLDALGNEKERRPFQPRARNLDTVTPIKIARRLPLAQVLTMFVFKHCHQIVHEDSLSFDFLFNLAKDLHAKGEMALIGAGPKGAQPLVVRERGQPYRAFLSGEISPAGDQYRLLMLLSDQELKLPAPIEVDV